MMAPMIELPNYQNNPPLKRNVTKDVEDLPSPMDPPEAYAPSNVDAIAPEDLAAPLQALMQDHEEFLKILTAFDRALVELKGREWRFTPEISAVLKRFFQWMDHEIPHHSRKEEKVLFPILNEKFLASGEHSAGVSPATPPVTPIDIMEADHLKVELGVNLVFNLLGLAARIKDAEARNLLFEHAFHEGQEIVEVMKLHIYKENTTLFPLAQKLLSLGEMSAVAEKMKNLGEGL